MSKDEEFSGLQVIPGEQGVDDLDSSIDKSFGCDDLTILAFAYYINPGDEDEYLKKTAAKRLRDLRKCLEDPEWKEALVKTLDGCDVFPVPFNYFEKTSYYQKMDIAQDVNYKCRKRGEDLIKQKFDELYRERKDKQKSLATDFKH